MRHSPDSPAHESREAAARQSTVGHHNAGNPAEAMRLFDEVETASQQVLRCLDALIAHTARKAA
jgi:hypothetical protein